MPHAQAGTRSLFHARSGRGEPLLLVQGMGGHHRMWGETFLALLEQHFEVAVFDHRGVGESTDDGAEFTTADLAQDAVAVLDAIGWADAHVLGISMGAMVTQELALAQPQRVRSLVLGCSWCGGPEQDASAEGAREMGQAVRAGNAARSLQVAYAVNLSAEHAAADPRGFRQFRDLSAAVRVPGHVVARQARACRAHDTSDRLPQLRVRTLVLHGTADRMIAPANGALVARLVPDAVHHEFEGVGHLFWLERPERSAELVRAHCLG